MKVDDRKYEDVVNDLDNLPDLSGKTFEDMISTESESKDFMEDFVQILDIYLDDKNVFKLTNTERLKLFDDSLLATMGDVPSFDRKIKPRYQFVSAFRYHYHIGRSSLKGAKSEQFRDIASSFIAFKSMLSFQRARYDAMDMDSEGKKKSILGR